MLPSLCNHAEFQEVEILSTSILEKCVAELGTNDSFGVTIWCENLLLIKEIMMCTMSKIIQLAANEA
jgi:hypothetical protein